MMWQAASIAITLVSLIVIFRARSYEQGILPLVPTSFFNIPLIMLGNTASAGIFPIDIVLLGFMLRFFVLSKSQSILSAYRVNCALLLTILACYALLRGGYVLLFDDYQYYERFIIYGMYRWLFFLCIFLIFLKITPGDRFNCLLYKLVYVLIAYFSFAILHQFGIVDLSGWSAIGSQSAYETDDSFKDISRAFLGNNAATVGCISVFGALLGILIYESEKNIARLVILLALLCLIGGGSRSDFMGTIMALITWLFFFGSVKYILPIIKASTMLIVFLLFSSSVFDLYGFNRLLETDFIGEASSQSEGTFAYRVYWWGVIAEHLLDDVSHLLFGYGPNGFRMLSVNSVTPMSYGHNVYLHTLGELGLVGLFLFILFLTKVFMLFVLRHQCLKGASRFLVGIAGFYLLQRLFAGISVDSILAVDNMIAMTIVFFFIVAAALSVLRTGALCRERELTKVKSTALPEVSGLIKGKGVGLFND